MRNAVAALIRRLCRPYVSEQDLDDEMRFHVETRADEFERTGLTRDEAVRCARLEFGSPSRYKEETRDARGFRFVTELRADVRSAWRQTHHDRGLTATIVATIALAIGVTGAVFAVIDAVVLHPLAYADPQRVVVVWATNPRVGMELVQARRTQNSIAAGEFAAWRDQSGVFDALAAVGVQSASHLTTAGPFMPLDIDEHAQPAGVAYVSDAFFDVVGVAPRVGRRLAPRTVRGADSEIVLLDSYFRRRFGSVHEAVGRTLWTDYGTPGWARERHVVGVMPREFAILSSGVDYLAPFSDFDEYATRAPEGHDFTAIGRLKAGLSLVEAQRRADAFARVLEARAAHRERGWRVELVPAAEDATGETRPFLLALLAAVVVLLFVLGVNTATLLVLKAVVRGRELAVRRAVGASAGRLLRQFVTESTALAVVGSVVGLLLAQLLLSWLRLASPNPKTWGGSFLQADSLHVGWSVVLFAIGAAVLIGAAFGIVPAWYASRTDPVEGLKDAAPGVIGGVRRRRLSTVLLAAQVVLAAVLATGAGLLLRSTIALFQRGPGFEYASRLVVGVRAGDQQVAERLVAAGHTRERVKQMLDAGAEEYWSERDRFRTEFTAKVASLPAVLGVTTATDAPMTGGYWLATFRPEPNGQGGPDECTRGIFTSVDANYFSELRVPLLAGRTFENGDRRSLARVVVISDVVAQRCWPGTSAIGKRLQSVNHPDKTWFTVVGVVGDTRVEGMNKPAVPHVYEPWSQNSWWWGAATFVVHTSGDPLRVVPSLRREMTALDGGAYLLQLHRLEDLVRDSAWRMNAAALLAVSLAAVSLLLAAIGIFGVLSHAVRERTREIGLRAALGADTADVAALVLRPAILAVSAGLAVGLSISAGLVQSLRALLFGVDPLDAMTFAAAGFVLVLIAALAASVPLRRALRLVPMIALRHE